MATPINNNDYLYQEDTRDAFWKHLSPEKEGSTKSESRHEDNPDRQGIEENGNISA